MPPTPSASQALWAANAIAYRAATTPRRPDPQALTARERSALRTQLWAAIKANDDVAVQAALDAGADPSQPKAGDPLKAPPLHVAAKLGNRAMVERLLVMGADPNQKAYAEASMGITLAQTDDPAIAERLIAAGLRIGYPTTDPRDANDHGLLVPALLRSRQGESPRLKTWWLERGGQGLPGSYWSTLPLTPPRSDRPWREQDHHAMKNSPWAGWLHTAAHHQDAGLAHALRERVMSWSALESAGQDPRRVWAPMVEAPWNDAILNDDVAALDWLVGQRWTPSSLLSEHGIAWAWTALTSNATNAWAWLIDVPGMREQMQQDVRQHPELTLHRPLEKPSRNTADRPFTGWTQPMLNRLVKAGVDVGAPNAQGDHLFHTALFAGEVDVRRPGALDEAANGTLVNWLARFRPDLVGVPNHEGLDLLALGDRCFGQRQDWLPQRARLEQAVLRGVAETVVDEPVVQARARRRL